MDAQSRSAAANPSPGPVPLRDRLGREVSYLRLSITDRCNLRCGYCMPAAGGGRVSRDDLLTLEEMERLVRVLGGLGISKVRITGGEPFARKGCMDMLCRLRALPAAIALHITTNGLEAGPHLDELARLGISSLNLSLDSLDPQRFLRITGRPALPAVLATLDGAVARGIPLKVNVVVLEDTGDDELLALAGLARDRPISVRFIEQMGLRGGGHVSGGPPDRPLPARLLPLLEGMAPAGDQGPATARLYTVPGFLGTVGVIESRSRRFCGSCNRVRITPRGGLRTCLYSTDALDLKAMLRGGATDREVGQAVAGCIRLRGARGPGREVPCAPGHGSPSMASIGG